MDLNTFREILMESFESLWAGVASIIPMILVAIIVIILGWAIGALLGSVVAQVIKVVKIDEALRRAGLEDLLKKGGIRLNAGYFIGALVKWFIIIVFLIAAFDILKLHQVTEFLTDVVSYLPQVIIAAIILIAAAIIGDVTKKIIVASSKTVDVKISNLLGTIAKWAIWIFAIVAALNHLRIAGDVVQILFMGIIIALSLAFGLAFGLGGKDSASRYLSKLEDEIS